MKTKFLLPMIAMIFAIGMSFATSSSAGDANMDYVQTDNGIVPIQEIECQTGDDPCRAQLEPNGTEYPIFDDPSLQNQKIGSGEVFRLY